jgi:exodeoxyribonuclease VII large subunit
MENHSRDLTVSQLTTSIRDLLADSFPDVWVLGEISGVRPAASGHYYFTLKDAGAQLRCVCYRGVVRGLKVKPQDGVAVRARGRIDVYEPRGEYQLLVEALEPQGAGALHLAFEQLKKKLAAEGLFEAERKRPLPRFPWRIGIVTSPTGAVIRDIIQVLARRFPGLHLRLYPALVQGEGAAAAVIEGIEWFSHSGWPDVVIVARGGGSIEDLWTFNEESVARAIVACPVPVISAVGHETDFTIADFVADLRAPTPSAAAEMVIRTRAELLDQIEVNHHKVAQSLRLRLAAGARRWQQSDATLRRMDVRLRIARAWQRLDNVDARFAELTRTRLLRVGGRLEALHAHLTQLSPLRILERGYAIVEQEPGGIVKDAAAVAMDSLLKIRLARGRLRARVLSSSPGDDA